MSTANALSYCSRGCIPGFDVELKPSHPHLAKRPLTENANGSLRDATASRRRGDRTHHLSDEMPTIDVDQAARSEHSPIRGAGNRERRSRLR